MPRFSLPRLRSRGRSVDSRQTAAASSSTAAASTSSSSTKKALRSVSVPPSHQAVPSNKSTAKSGTGSRSVATTKTSSSSNNNLRAAGMMSYSYSYDDVRSPAVAANDRAAGSKCSSSTVNDGKNGASR